MTRQSLCGAAVALVAVVAFGCGPETVADTQKSVEEHLTCQCGCGLTVHTCNHLQCSFGVPVKQDIAESLASGQSGEQILTRYVEKYGEKILSSPTRRGFNLLAWYGPYVAVAASALVIVFVLLRWQRKSTAAEADGAGEPKPAVSGDAKRRIEAELDELEP